MIMNKINLQPQLDACAAAGGGCVTVPRGEYITGTLYLRDNVELHIPAGSTLYASEDPADYPHPVSERWNVSSAPRHDGRSLIYADGVRNAAVTGEGCIDCQGTSCCKEDPSPMRVNALRRTERCIMPRVMLLACCEHITLRDFTIKDAPAGWSVWMTGCSDCTVQGVRLLADRELPNADGLHINCCQDIRVSDCRFETGDDALVIRAFSEPHHKVLPCERITVTNCVLMSNSSAVRIGWCGDGDIQDCVLSNLVIHDSVNGLVCQLPFFKTRAADQGTALTKIRRISFQNIVMDRVFFEPIHLSVADGVQAELSSLHFDSIHALSRRVPRFSGSSEHPIRDVSLCGCIFDVVPTLDTPFRIPDAYWDEHSFDGLPAVRHVEHLRLDHFELNHKKNSSKES